MSEGGNTLPWSHGKPGKIPVHWGFHIEPTRIHQHGRERLRHRLGDRGYPEAGRQRVGHSQLPVGEPIRVLKENLISARNEDDAAQPFGLSLRPHQCVDASRRRRVGGRRLGLGRNRDDDQRRHQCQILHDLQSRHGRPFESLRAAQPARIKNPTSERLFLSSMLNI